MIKFNTVWNQVLKTALIVILGFCVYMVFLKYVKLEKYTVSEKLQMTLWTVTVFDYMAQKGILPGRFKFSVEPGKDNKYVLVKVFVDDKLYCSSEVNDKMLGLFQSVDMSDIMKMSNILHKTTITKDLQNCIPLCLNYAIAAKGVYLTEGGEIFIQEDERGEKFLMYDSAVLTIGNHWSVTFEPKHHGFIFHGGK